MQVEVVRSPRRSRTVSLRPTAEGVRISIPAWSTKAEEEEYVRQLLRQYERQRTKKDISLTERARLLARRYRLQVPASIEWSGSTRSRWGSCNVQTGNIRISADVKPFPQWVIDYVIIHELAHLSYGGHGVRFWGLVERYPKTERARGFLIAKGMESNDPENESGEDAENESGEETGKADETSEVDLRDNAPDSVDNGSSEHPPAQLEIFG